MSLLFCRECAEGKHGNCDGTAWDNEADATAPCTCPDPSHPRVLESRVRSLAEAWTSAHPESRDIAGMELYSVAYRECANDLLELLPGRPV